MAWESASINPAANPAAPALPPHCCGWRWISPGLAWGSLKLSRPGFHGCSPVIGRKVWGLAGNGAGHFGSEKLGISV